MFSSLFRPKNSHRSSFSRQRPPGRGAQLLGGHGRYVDDASEAGSNDDQEVDVDDEHAGDDEDEGEEERESSEDGADNREVTPLLPIFSAAHLGIH